MKKIILVIIFPFLMILFFSFFLINKNAVLENILQNIDIVNKGQDITIPEQWIVLANEKKVYVEDFSIWALINENENYTVNYVLMKESGRYRLIKIVPGDYNGTF